MGSISLQSLRYAVSRSFTGISLAKLTNCKDALNAFSQHFWNLQCQTLIRLKEEIEKGFIQYMQHDVAIKGVEINEEKSPLGILQKEVSPKKCYKMEAHKPISIKLESTHGIHIDLNASKSI